MQSIHGLAITQSCIQQKQPVEFDGFGTHGYMLYLMDYTVEYWIQQKQPVEFDGFGTHGYMLYSLGYTVEYWIHQKQPWSLMDLVHMATCSIHWAILWSTESNKSSWWSLMDLVHMATCSIHWAILWSTE